MNANLWSALAVACVCLATVVIGSVGLRLARATSDFYVAGRSVSPRRNASAISGEYLSAASFLGVAALVYDRGVDMLWFPVGYTIGYVVLLVLVAAPLRRSGAYTLPDFAEARLQSRTIRALCTVLVIAIGWLYLLPQLQGAGLALQHVTGLPTWVGSAVVALVVLVNVGAAGMRSITLVQAMQYWLKLAAISIPAFVLLAIWVGDGRPRPQTLGASWAEPFGGFAANGHPLYATWSTMIALALGTMGLPHVVVRFYTNPDGRDARRTILSVVPLLGVFYLFPPLYAVLGRVYLPGLPEGSRSDLIMLDLPGAVLGGAGGTALTALIAGGAFAAFLATASGLVLSVSTALHQDLIRPRLDRVTGDDATTVGGFRLATLLAVAVPFALCFLLAPLGLATTVGLAFAVAASTFAPLLVLGVWWRRLSTTGAAAGLAVGGLAATVAVGVTILDLPQTGWVGALLAQPAAWCTPAVALVMVVVSLLTPRQVPAGVAGTLVRLHTPEQVRLLRPREDAGR